MGTAWLGHSRACTPLLPPLPQLGGGRRVGRSILVLSWLLPRCAGQGCCQLGEKPAKDPLTHPPFPFPGFGK